MVNVTEETAITVRVASPVVTMVGYSEQLVQEIMERLELPEKTSDLYNDGDGTSAFVTAQNLSAVATSGDYNDLSNKPEIPSAEELFGQVTLPEKTSDLYNDGDGTSAFVTAQNLSAVATSGDYNDLINLPSASVSPTDYVVECGRGSTTGASSLTWSWRKWNSGIMECWIETYCVLTGENVCSEAWGGMYRSAECELPMYPQTFLAKPNCMVTLMLCLTEKDVFLRQNCNGTVLAPPTFRFFAGYEGAIVKDPRMQCYAIGKYK